MTGFLGPDDGDRDDLLARFLGGGPRGPVRRVDLTRLMSSAARELVAAAAQLAMERGDTDLDSLHLLLAATRLEPTRQWLGRAGVSPDAVAAALDRALAPGGAPSGRAPSLTPAAKKAMLDGHQVARSLGSSWIGPDHLLLAIAAHPESDAGRLLTQARLDAPPPGRAAPGPGPLPPPGPAEGRRPDSSTPTLDQFGQDLTAAARGGRLDPVIGRADEIEQTVEVLSRRTKNNPVLIGEPGVGKTAIVEGLARRIVSGDVPESLRDRRVVALDIGARLAGSK